MNKYLLPFIDYTKPLEGGACMAAGGPVFVFNTIIANGLETNGAVLVGQNNAANWVTHNKNQVVTGFIFGAFNTFPNNVNILNDQDFIDTPINDNDIEPIGPTTQT
jgi:hypothetical protein